MSPPPSVPAPILTPVQRAADLFFRGERLYRAAELEAVFPVELEDYLREWCKSAREERY
jgi:hypothetical protein